MVEAERQRLAALEPTKEGLDEIAGKSSMLVRDLALLGIWRELWMLRTALEATQQITYSAVDEADV